MLALVRKIHSQWPLALQVMVTTVLVLVLNGTLAFWYLDYKKRQEIDSEINQQISIATGILSSVVFEAIVSEDIDILETSVEEAFNNNSAILSIAIYNEDSELLAAWPIKPQLSKAAIEYQQPIIASGEVFGQLRIFWDSQPIVDRVSENSRYVLLLILSFISIVGLLFVLFIRRLIIIPVNAIHRYLRHSVYLRQDEKKYSVVLPNNMPPELQQFSELAKELSAKQQQLIQAAKLASVGEMAVRMGHELNNPLSIVSMNIELLQYELMHNEHLSEDEKQQLLELVEVSFHHCQRMDQVIKKMADFSSDVDQEFAQIAVNGLVDDAIATIKHSLDAKDIVLHLLLAKNQCWIWGAYAKISTVVINVLNNAQEALEVDSNVVNKIIKITVRWDRSWVYIDIVDNGPGIAKDIIDKVFDPFFTTKNNEQSVGLGLAACNTVLKQHGGALLCESKVGEGCCFTIKLPLYSMDSGIHKNA